MPSKLPFSRVIKVRYSDVDAQGHLYFANYMVYADEITGQYMEDLGWIIDPAGAPSLVFTVTINCEYVDECVASDEVRVCVGYTRLGNSSADVSYELYRDDSDVLLSRGTITQVFVDKQTRESYPIPAAFRSAIVARQPELAGAA